MCCRQFECIDSLKAYFVTVPFLRRQCHVDFGRGPSFDVVEENLLDCGTQMLTCNTSIGIRSEWAEISRSMKSIAFHLGISFLYSRFSSGFSRILSILIAAAGFLEMQLALITDVPFAARETVLA